MKEELDLFHEDQIEMGIIGGQVVPYAPLASLTDGGPIEFEISRSGQDYINLENIKILVDAKVVQANGTPLPEGANVAPAPNFLHSLFSQVDVFLNNVLITSSNNTYAYRAYLETLLSFGQEAKNSQLTMGMWYQDTPGYLDSVNEDENAGFKMRKEILTDRRGLNMLGRVHVDMMLQRKYLLNNVPIKMRFVLNPSTFCLMTDEVDKGYKVVITGAKLLVHHVQLNSALTEAHTLALKHKPAQYPVKRMLTKNYTVGRGSLSGDNENLFIGQLPLRMFVGLVDNDAYNGSYQKNPFNFKHYNIKYLAASLNGKLHPMIPLTPDFAQKIFVRCYESLFSVVNKSGFDEGNQISMEDYPKGFTLFAIDLTPDLGSAPLGIKYPTVTGKLGLHISFAQPLPQNVHVVVLAEFQNIIEININRDVSFDYGA